MTAAATGVATEAAPSVVGDVVTEPVTGLATVAAATVVGVITKAASHVLTAAVVAAASEPKAGTPRFVVQAGAYSEAGALRDARQKVEKLGLKTYTQVIEGDTGKRTRVRIGPFATRQEAEAVAAKVKATGLQASILAL